MLTRALLLFVLARAIYVHLSIFDMAIELFGFLVGEFEFSFAPYEVYAGSGRFARFVRFFRIFRTGFARCVVFR